MPTSSNSFASCSRACSTRLRRAEPRKGPAGAVIALLILFLMREPQRTGGVRKAQMEKGGVLSLLKNKAYLTSILGYAAVTFSLGGISWWMPSFLQRVEGYSIEAAGGVMGPIIVVCGLGGTALGGWLAQWWSKRTAKALYLCAGDERVAGGAAGSAVLLWAYKCDPAGIGGGGVSYFSGDGASERGDAECGAR